MSDQHRDLPPDSASLSDAIEEGLEQEKGKAIPVEEEEYAPPVFTAYDDYLSPLSRSAVGFWTVVVIFYALIYAARLLVRLLT